MAQQLHLVDDTALADDPRLAPRTVLRQPCARRREDSASSTVRADTRVAAIDRARLRAGMSHEELCRAARAGLRNWFRLRRGDHRPSEALLARLEAAVAGAVPAPRPALVRSYHRLVMRLLAAAQGLDPDAVAAVDLSVQRPMVQEWLRAARIHNMAIYLTTVELEVSNLELGRALGLSREAVRKARNRIEDLRDDPEVDALLARATQQARG